MFFVKELFSIYLLVIQFSIVSIEANVENVKPSLPFKEIIKENEKYNASLDACYARIVGGKAIPIELVPYQIGMVKQVQSWAYTFCGGALVTTKYIMTAAHCFVSSRGNLNLKLRDVWAIAGHEKSRPNLDDIYSQYKRRIKFFWKHENVELGPVHDDIGIVEVFKQFVLSTRVKPIRMHTSKAVVSLRSGTRCGVTGYGRKENNEESEELRLVCLHMVDWYVCLQIYGRYYVSAQTVCAGDYGLDSCQGDSGGPLVCDGILVGILSLGGICGKHPAVYTKVLDYTTSEKVPFQIATQASSTCCAATTMITCIAILMLNFQSITFF